METPVKSFILFGNACKTIIYTFLNTTASKESKDDNKKEKSSTTTVTSCFIFTLYYKWSFCIFVSVFLIYFYSWYEKNYIVCKSLFNVEQKVSDNIKNICLSYPFIYKNNRKIFIVRYRWIPWSMLLLALIYHCATRNFNAYLFKHKYTNEILLYLKKSTHLYDESSEKLKLKKCTSYFKYLKNQNNEMYVRCILLNIILIFMNLAAFKFFDFILSGDFFFFGLSLLSSRNYALFDDNISMIFPPFVHCEINEHFQIMNQRNEQFGCHLTFMEMYEKIFFFLWFWILGLTFLSVSYILFLLCLPIFFKLLILRDLKINDKNSKKIFRKGLLSLQFGDVYVLYLIKSYFSSAGFKKLVCRNI